MSEDSKAKPDEPDISRLATWVGKQAVFRDEGLWLVEILSVTCRDQRLTIGFRTIPYPDRTGETQRIGVSADVHRLHSDNEQCFGINLPWHIDVSRRAVTALRTALDELPEGFDESRPRQVLWAAYQRHYSALRVSSGQ